MTQVLYITQSYVPSRRASSIQVMRMSDAVAALGHHVELVTKHTPKRLEPSVSNDFHFYGVAERFELTKLRCPNRRGGRVLYGVNALRLVFRKRKTSPVVISRDIWTAVTAARLGLATVYEAHGLPKGRVSRALIRMLFKGSGFRKLVVISQGLRRDLERHGLAPEDSTTVEPDGADPDYIAPRPIEPARMERPRVGYVGHLFPGRGIELIADLARRLPKLEFIIVGGNDSSVESWRSRAPSNLRFEGFVPPADLPDFYANFDILLMPYQRKVSVYSNRTDTATWMSPLKMFEYMATGLPIVASDLPVLREVLKHEANALLAPPDDVAVWEAALKRLILEPELGPSLGRAARRDIEEKYSWRKRAERILEGVV